MIQPLTTPASLHQLGGKGFNLGVMLRAGLPVPAGFVVDTDAYRAFVDANGLQPRIEAAWAAACAGGPDAFEAASATLRAAFEAGEIPAALRDTFPNPTGPVAVRSSATAEDLPEASFAGQQDTYLEVRGRAAVLDAVRRCWGSLWTARAMAYRARQGIPPHEVALAVVVQDMAPAEAAGVLFTVHPTTGAADQVVINATWGLGEALVSGRVNPDTVVADKTSGAVLRVELGDKQVMTTPTGAGTAETAVPEARRAQRSVTDEQVAALVGLARALEVLFGGPQDVEWAIVDGAPVLLQSRPVTRGAVVPGDDAWPPVDRARRQPFDFWTHQDMGERWPDPVTPLTWSICEPMNQQLMDEMVSPLHAPWAGQIRWTCRVMGHVWFNEGALLHAYTHGMGMPIAWMASGLTHPGARPVGAEHWQLGRVLRHLPFYWRAATTWEANVAAFERAFPTIDAQVDTFMEEDLGARPDAELLHEALHTWFGRVVHHVRFHTNATSLAMGAYTELEGQMARWLGAPELAQSLVGGLTGVIAAEMVPELAALADCARATGVAPTVTGLPPQEVLGTLRTDPRADPLLDALARFLRRHGHRCMVEAELRHPRWAEAPEAVIEAIANLLRSPSPRGAGASATERREQLTAEVEAKLGVFRRAAFRRTLQRVHHFTRVRDNGQHHVVKLLMPVRRLLAALGARWAARGWLATPDDVFFLVREDLEAATAAGTGDGLQARADARRLAFDHWNTVTCPDALDALGLPVAPTADAGDPFTLTGIAASRGTVSGIARVIATPQEAARLAPGDILVTRATDPGWTPVFGTIGGAVLEIGGLLSHGAIVAREYGLPAVVNVPNATRRIVDGQTITVDGTTGRVHLGPSAARGGVGDAPGIVPPGVPAP